MKSVSTFLNVVLLIAVGVLYYLQFSSKSATNSVDPVETETNALKVDANIVYLNTDSLWEQYEYVQKMKADLLDEKQRLESQYERELRAFEQDYINFQERAARFSDRQRQIEQESLMQKEQEMLALKENLAIKLAQSEQDKNLEIQNAIYRVLDDFNIQNKHTMIFGMSATSDLLLANPNLDITKQIVAKLNEDYRNQPTSNN